MTKPFKKIFNKKSKHDMNITDNNNNMNKTQHPQSLQSRSYSVHPHRKYNIKSKSKSKAKSASDPNISKNENVNLKKLIDKKLIQQYEEYVKQRIEMLQTHAFPHQVIHQLPQYRADLS